MDPIALDAMGGDLAPAAAVGGALRAHADGLDVVLVGQPDAINAALRHAGAPDALPVVDAADVVGDEGNPAISLRAKPHASIAVAARLVAQRRAGALVSAGSTGATLAAALLAIGRVDGVRRPVVAAVLPVGDHGVVLVDAGGSADPQPEALVAAARMGVAYARVRGVARPRAALLNVGGERGKGNALTRAAYDLLRDEQFFAGNVEPPAVLAGEVDVVVTDGFTGNVFLKTVEAAGPAGHPQRHPGAAVVLGINGEVLVAHGAADEHQFVAALRTAEQVAAAGLSQQVAARLGEPPRERADG